MLEIGPGKGILTDILVDSVSRVIAIEKDDHLYDRLSKMYREHSNITLIHNDVLDLDLSGIIVNNIKIVANLPYNIASQFIIRLIAHARSISCVVVMVQKEVGERICAQAGAGSYSALSVIVASAFDATEGFTVMPSSFFPRPKVDSIVIRLSPKASPIHGTDIDRFNRFVFHAFSGRRKMLKNTLSTLPHMNHELLDNLAGVTGVEMNKRPQEISLNEYLDLYREYQTNVTEITKSM